MDATALTMMNATLSPASDLAAGKPRLPAEMGAAVAVMGALILGCAVGAGSLLLNWCSTHSRSDARV